MRAQFVLQEVWTGLRRNLTMTVALIVVVAISLSLLGTGLLFVKQVDDTRTYWQGKVQGRPGVDQVVDDASILSKFYALLDGARNAVVIIAIILIIAAVLLVANTIRLSAFNRRRETSIMRLVGASNFYVQLPFLVEGILAGMAGWLIAAGLLIAVKTLGLDSLQQYFPYNVQLSGADLIEVIVLAMVMGVLL